MFSEEFEILFSIVEKELKISKKDIVSKSRKGPIMDARRIVVVIAKKNSKLSLKKIGNKLGGRDHATILNSLNKHKALYASDKEYIEKFNKVNYKYLSSSIVSDRINNTIKSLKTRKRTLSKYIDEQIIRIKNDSTSSKKSKSLNVGLFMGSFNPIHNGHMIIANTALHACDFDEVWFVVSPESPDKIGNKEMLDFEKRVELIKGSIMDNPSLKVSSIEGELPKPSYTSVTLRELRGLYKNYNFSLILGSDNLINIDKWKDFDDIILNHKIYYFKRPDSGNMHLENSIKYSAEEIPSISNTNISSTKIRKIIEDGSSFEMLRYLIPDECMYLIEKNGYYKGTMVKEVSL